MLMARLADSLLRQASVRFTLCRSHFTRVRDRTNPADEAAVG